MLPDIQQLHEQLLDFEFFDELQLDDAHEWDTSLRLLLEELEDSDVKELELLEEVLWTEEQLDVELLQLLLEWELLDVEVDEEELDLLVLLEQLEELLIEKERKDNEDDEELKDLELLL